MGARALRTGVPNQNSKGAEKSSVLAADTTAAKSRARLRQTQATSSRPANLRNNLEFSSWRAQPAGCVVERGCDSNHR
jgi:hypothetical protein